MCYYWNKMDHFRFFFNFSEERTDLHVTLLASLDKIFPQCLYWEDPHLERKIFFVSLLTTTDVYSCYCSFFLVCEEVLSISAVGRAFLRPREDLRQVGESFTGGLVLIMPDPLQISRRLAFAQGLIPSCERGGARVGALILLHMRLINMTEKSKWL